MRFRNKHKIVIFTVLIMIAMLTVSVVFSQDEVTITIYLDEETLTIYIPGSQTISVENFGFEVTINGERQSFSPEDYSAFQLRFDQVSAPICFRLAKDGTSKTPPLACNPTRIITQTLAAADIFWYDTIISNFRTLTILKSNEEIGLCTAGNFACDVALPVVLATEEPVVGTINTPTPFSTQLPIITQNDDWEIQEQDFDDVTMVLVPPGSFEMGSKPNEVNIAVAECSGSHVNNHICPESFFTDETPTSIQEFKQAFWIDRTEITRSQYQLCVNSGWCDPIPTSIFSQEPSQPINRVTWFQANTYCEWRNSRLPTESEWEYAARGSDTLIFPWGNTFNGKFANHCDLNCGSAAWSSSYEYVHEENNDNFAVTSPVGSYPDGASWVGALDMSGNVREWTSSPYLLYPYDLQYEQGGNNGELSKNYVLRGGSFGNTSFQLRASYRRAESPTNGFNNFGIRCARDYEQ